MDTRNTRSRKAIETLSQAFNEPTMKDLYAMLLSVIQRLDSIENDLLKGMTAVEESVENAHYRVSELEHQMSIAQKSTTFFFMDCHRKAASKTMTRLKQ